MVCGLTKRRNRMTSPDESCLTKDDIRCAVELLEQCNSKIMTIEKMQKLLEFNIESAEKLHRFMQK